MSLPHYESQALNELLNQECSFSHKPLDENEATCDDCHTIFQKNCVYVIDKDITFKRPHPSAVRSPSPVQSASSSCSNRSHAKQSRKIDLKLQKLEEEHKLYKQYLDEKYELLEEAEAITDISDETFQTGRDWLASTELPNNTVSNVNHPTDLQTPNLPNQTYNINLSSVPSNIVSKTMPQNSVGSVPPTVTSAAINSSPTMATVPNCTTAIPTYSGY